MDSGEDSWEERDVVTCFLRHGTEVLLLQRSDAVGTYPGSWGGVSGYAEGTPEEAARWEIDEEVGLLEAVEFVRSADPLVVADDSLGTRWLVHPFLFECASTDVEPNEEIAGYEWVQPPAMLERETVPALWETYCAVAPTVETVRDDTAHGASSVSLRSLEVLRDRAADATQRDGGFEQVAETARRLRAARPSMGVVATRIDRVMTTTDWDAESVLARATNACARAVSADGEAAAEAADRIGERVLTLSRSGTVLAAVRRANPEAIFVAESRPAREGVGVAEELATDHDVSLFVDAAIGHVVATEAVDTVLIGADAVLSDGTVVNKVGSRLAALAAADESIDCYAVCSRDKVTPDEPDLETRPPGEVYDGDADLRVRNPTFEEVPADLVTIVTEDGVLSADDVTVIAAEHAEFATWTEG